MMRRDVAVAAAITLGLAFSSCGQQPPPKPARPCPSGQACMAVPTGDEVDGCDTHDDTKGAALVKVKIKLKNDQQSGCSVDSVKPERVCVMQGGVVRWKVQNNCQQQGQQTDLQISGIQWLTDTCEPVLRPVKPGSDKKNVILCGVPEETAVDRYKYSVELGTSDAADPWIEVKRGG